MLILSFMYPHHNTTIFKKTIKVDHKIKGCIIFGNFLYNYWPSALFWEN